jgi:hypothetical protein
VLKVRVRNLDLFALDYSRLAVDIKYRGSGRGRVHARVVSYIDADLHLDGIRVVEDAFYLLEDLTRVRALQGGHMRFFFLSIPGHRSIPKFSLLFLCYNDDELDYNFYL